jgi:two-component system response regulator RegA
MSASVPPYQVVIVDDDDLALGALRRLVAYWGFDVVPFSRFEDARAFISSRSPDALIVDVRLGEYNGLQLVHLAKQAAPHIAVIAMSGFDDAVLRAEAERVGATYLVKPLDLSRLRQFLPGPTGMPVALPPDKP